MTNDEAELAALEWIGQAGGVLLPQLTANELAGLVNEAIDRSIIDGPGVEPVGEFIRFGIDNYPSLQWHKDYVAKFGDKLYLAAPSAPAVHDEFCEWKPMDDEFMPGTYEGSCGVAWAFTDGGPKENTLNFCPECGRKVASP